jgi:hypothetical protein
MYAYWVLCRQYYATFVLLDDMEVQTVVTGQLKASLLARRYVRNEQESKVGLDKSWEGWGHGLTFMS